MQRGDKLFSYSFFLLEVWCLRVWEHFYYNYYYYYRDVSEWTSPPNSTSLPDLLNHLNNPEHRNPSAPCPLSD